MNRFLRPMMFVVPGLMLVAACATQTPGTTPVATTPATVVSDVNTIAAALQAELPALSAIPGVNVGSVSSAIADVQKAASAVTAAMALTSSQSSVNQIAADVSALVGAIPPGVLPPNVQTVITAAQVLLPVVELAVGLAAPAGATPTSMTADQARAVLKAAAGH